MKAIRPHGGTLVNREVTGVERERLIESAAPVQEWRRVKRVHMKRRPM